MSLENGVVLSHLLKKPLLLKNVQPIIGGNSFQEKHHYQFPVNQRIPAITDLFDVPVPTYTIHDAPGINNPITLNLIYKDEEFRPMLGTCIVSTDRPVNEIRSDPGFQQFLGGRTDIFFLDDSARNADILHTLKKGYLGNYESIFYIDNKQTRHELYGLLSDLRPKSEYLNVADKISRDLGKYNSLHIRLSDYRNYCHSDATTILKNIAPVLPRSEKLVILTDQSESSEFFLPLTEYYSDSVFLDEIIVNDYQDILKQLPFSDNIVIALLSQHIARSARTFIGHPTSTYTGYIQRLRFFDDMAETNRYSFKHKDFNIDNELKTPINNPDARFTWNKFILRKAI
jgi:hypothetical protein